MSKEHILFVHKIKKRKRIIIFSQIFITSAFFLIWELCSRFNIINSFIFSSPTKIIKTLIDLYQNNNLLKHIFITSKEVIISFTLSSILGFFIALLLYLFNTLKRIVDPFITILNSLPKVALGPLIIIWIGANQKSIIVMALLINLIVTMNTILNGLENTDKETLKVFKIFKASKKDILLKLIIPSSRKEIISALKINISMSLIGLSPLVGENFYSNRYYNKCLFRYL